MKVHSIHSLATGAVVLTTLLAPIAITSAAYAGQEQPKFNAQFFNSSKSGDKAVEEAKQKALKKKQEDAEKEEEIKAAAEKFRQEEEKKAEMKILREKAAERRRIKAAKKQAELEAKRQRLARQKAEREESRKRQAQQEAQRQAKIAAKNARKAERLKEQQQERAERIASRHRAAEIRTTSVHTKSGKSRAKKIAPPTPEDHAALHKHYANWVSYYAGGSVSKTSIDGESGASLGAFAGKNWQKGKYVYGVEGELSLLNGEQTNSDGLHFDANWMLSAKGRAGYLVRPDTLLYATGGIAFADFDIRLDRQNYSETLVGFIIGAGVEHQLDEDWSVRAEYAYTDFGNEKVGNSSFDPDIHAFKVSFSYSF